MARCDAGGPGILFNGQRILGVRAQDGRLAGDLGSDAARLLREVDGELMRGPGVTATQSGDGERARAKGNLGRTLG